MRIQSQRKHIKNKMLQQQKQMKCNNNSNNNNNGKKEKAISIVKLKHGRGRKNSER